MQIRNCLIITDADSVLALRPEETRNFIDNVIYSHAKIPARLLSELRDHTAFSGDANAASPNHRRATVDDKVAVGAFGD